MKKTLFLLFVILFALACGGEGGNGDGNGNGDEPEVCNDRDGDGFGNPASSTCTHNQLDCNDNNENVNPGIVEASYGDPVCIDGADNDCDGHTDEEDNGCQECALPGDCNDGNPCTDDNCVDFACVYNNNNDPCNDGDNCTMDDVCASGACSGVPLDADADTYVSDSCGGNDCDDSNRNVNPGVNEGPPGDPTCTDGIDNDCDNQADGADSDCLQTAHNTGNEDFTVADGEEADPLNGYRVDDPDSEILPSSIDHSANIPDVKDQGNTSSCTSWAVGYYAKTYQEVIEEEWDKDQNAFSPMYLYALQCRYYQRPWDFIAAWEVLNRDGCAKLTTMPFEDLGPFGPTNPEKQTYANKTIPEAARTEAMEYRAGEMSRLYNLNQVKQALTTAPVLLGIHKYAGPPEPTSPENNYMTYDPDDNSGVGHAILCVGYDDSKFGTGALHFVNSWGIGWAVNGYSWIKYSDLSNIATFAMTYKDIPNRNTSENTTSRPDAPTGVSASDNVGPYVDIRWSKVSAAHYYRIYRARTDDHTTYDVVGITYENTYRDFPEPGVAFFYSVIAVNDLGESPHSASDTDEKGYVDTGTAIGANMAKPTLTWTSNNSDGSSNFSVSNVDPEATSMAVHVSTASEGPWYSLGWIEPLGFMIAWGDDSEYVGKKPYVRVLVAKNNGYSEFSDPAQVGTTIVSTSSVATITTFTAEAHSAAITLAWTTDGGNADFFEVWRYKAVADQANDWILIDYTASGDTSYEDTTALPGISYYYALFAVYQGTYSEYAMIEDPVSIPITGSNLYLYGSTYWYGPLTNPVPFEITVWNTGATSINDYSLAVLAYDWNEDTIYEVAVFNASDVAFPGQLPLPSGFQHTLAVSLTIPSAFADGHYYSWIVWIDYYDTIDELYEDDNFVWSYDYWWLISGGLSATKQEVSKLSTRTDSWSDSKVGSTRPFSKKRQKKMEIKSIASGGKNTYVGPIRYKQPSFCNNHAE